MPDRVRITDVSPRDGLQNEPGVIPTADKARLIQLLCGTGVDEVEITSFVSAKWVPQLGDAAELCKLLAAFGASETPVFSALVPNDRGMLSLLEANRAAGRALIAKASVFTAASEEFARRNTNATISETLDRFVPVIQAAHAQSLTVRGYISCVIACPFAGPTAPDQVVRIANRLRSLGVDELDLGDTIGAATPESTNALLQVVGREWPIHDSQRVTLHLHDTFGRAADCVKAALDQGVRSFDGSVAGLGGCPYAGTPGKPAPGNISTELLVRTIHQAGYETGVDEAKLAQAAAFAREIVAKARRSTPPQ